MRTPAEDAQKLSEALEDLAQRLRAIDQGQAVFSREDLEREADELRARLAARHRPDEHPDRLGPILGELDRSSQRSQERS